MKAIYHAGLCALVFLTTAALAFAQPPSTDVRVGSIPNDITCEKAAEVVSKPAADVTPEQYNMYLMTQQQCFTESYNRAHPDDPKVVYGTVDAGAKKVLFNTISVNDAAKLRTACKALITGAGVVAFDGDPLMGTLVGAGGQVSCEQYFKAAVESNPLIIVMPAIVPGYQLTKDGLSKVFQQVHLPKIPEGPKIPKTPVPVFPKPPICYLLGC